MSVTDDEIIEQYVQDDPILPVQQIYNELGIGPNYLYAVLRNNDIPLRRTQGITSRGPVGSIMQRYDDETKEAIRVLRYIERVPMTGISARLKMPYDHVRAIVTDLKFKDEEAIASVDHSEVLLSFKDGASMEQLQQNFHLTATQLLIILDGGQIKRARSEWADKQGIVDQVLDQIRQELNLSDGQQRLPL